MLTSLVFFGSCANKQNEVEESDILDLVIQTADKNQKIVDKPQNWHFTNKKVCVLFGYGFNDEETYKPILSHLDEQFGLAENGGLIYPLFYPESFKHGVRGYVNDFLLEMEDLEKDFCAVVILGAPDRTHVSLARHQDFWKQKVPYPVIAFYPQDDVLGIEATCDIVIEKAQVADLTGAISEENNEIDVGEVKSVINDTVSYILCTEGAFSKNSDLQKHVNQMMKGRKFHRYLDPETGLQSVNHFVLY